MTIVDGLIASRDALYHSANYRSVVAFGTAREVTDRDEKEAVLERMTRRYFPGRTVGEHYRAPSDADLKITSLLAIEIEEIEREEAERPTGEARPTTTTARRRSGRAASCPSPRPAKSALSSRVRGDRRASPEPEPAPRRTAPARASPRLGSYGTAASGSS